MLNTVLINPEIVSLTLGLLTNSEIMFLLIVIKPHLSAFRINGQKLYNLFIEINAHAVLKIIKSAQLFKKLYIAI